MPRKNKQKRDDEYNDDESRAERADVDRYEYEQGEEQGEESEEYDYETDDNQEQEAPAVGGGFAGGRPVGGGADFDTSGRGSMAIGSQGFVGSQDAGTDAIPDGTAERNRQSVAGYGGVAPIMASTEVNNCLDILFEGQNLSNEFKTKASTIFEAAINEKMSAFAEQLDVAYKGVLQEQTENMIGGFAQKLDDYLTYVVEEWMQNNELSVERGIKTDISESFIKGLKQLFEAHYVNVPDERYDVLDDLFEVNESLQSELNTQINANVNLNAQLGEHQKSELVEHYASDLAATDKERFISLTENVSFDTAEVFNSKLHEIKEAYFPQNLIPESLPPQQLLEETTNQKISTGTPMDNYVDTVSFQYRNK